jgi:SAM-dependent methyltransferase
VPSPIDVDAFRAFEWNGWQESADPYDAYFGPLTSQAIDPLLGAVKTDASPDGQPGALLDVATGPGYLALRAKDAGFHPVLGVDFSEAMVRKARAFCAGHGIEIREGDAEHLDSANESFDAVAMNFGLLHLGRPAQAVAEAHRVLRRGGKYGFTVWAEPEKSRGFELVLRAIEAHGDATDAVPEGPPFFRYASAAHATAVLTGGGFADPSVRELPLAWILPSGEALFDAFLRGTARTGGLLRRQTPAALSAIRAAIVKGAEAYASGSAIHVPMRAVLASGTKR